MFIIYEKCISKIVCKGELVEIGSIFKYSGSVEVITAENAIQALTKD